MCRRALIVLAALCTLSRVALARVVRLDILTRTDVAGGAPFGSGGPYERITGRVYFAFDPNNPRDKQIVDLALAPRNASGEVEAWAEFVMLRPKDATRSANVALVDVVNRGRLAGVFHLNVRRADVPDSTYGDALLLRQGLTVVSLGWQWDVVPSAALLHFGAPSVGDAAHPVTGIVRSDITIDAPTNTIPLGHRNGPSQAVGYPVAEPSETTATLTVRDGPFAPRTVVARGSWRFGRDDGGRVVDDLTSVYMAAGFQPGKIYEVVYRAKDNVVVGAGLAAVRDMISYLKYDPAAIAPVRYGIAYGVSQTGRFLRQFLYQGFNSDESGRQAFDGFFIHTAGAGRGSFNHRFAQPSRDAQPYTTFFYPTDVFPFTSLEESDPVTKARGGLRALVGRVQYLTALPKVFYVDGGHEYWGRAASLTHTSVDGTQEIGFLPSERRYVIGSAQHSSPGPFPPAGTTLATAPAVQAYRGDPLDQRLALRALLVDLIDWVKKGTAPPPSLYPTLAGRTLVKPEAVSFPKIPNVPVARIPMRPVRMDFGPRWSEGIVDFDPPRLGAPYSVLVPQIDSVGNDLGGIRSVEIQVPLATYFPWQLRTGAPAAQDHLISFAGTFVPLSRTEAERAASGDTRPSIERLYRTRLEFLDRVQGATGRLVNQRFLLAEDAGTVRDRMLATWTWLTNR